MILYTKTVLDTFLDDCLSSSFIVARKKLNAFSDNYKHQMLEREWRLLSDQFVSVLFKKLDQKRESVPFGRLRWAKYARVLLSKEIERLGYIDISNDEIIYQILGSMGKCFVFGVYHGDIISLPKSVALRIMVLDFKGCFGEFFRDGCSLKVLELHLPQLNHKRMSSEQNIRSHTKIAEFLEEFDGVKGLYGASWYYDPVVREVSPNLAFFNEFSVSNGATIFNMGRDQAAIDDSLRKSFRRKKLYESGEYLPTRYGRFWSSKSIIRWSKEANIQL